MKPGWDGKGRGRCGPRGGTGLVDHDHDHHHLAAHHSHDRHRRDRRRRAAAAGTLPPVGVLAADATITPAATDAPAATGSDVASPVITEPVAVGAAASATEPGTEVLGESITRPETLARTGARVGGIALLGGLLCGGGRLAVLARRLLRIG